MPLTRNLTTTKLKRLYLAGPFSILALMLSATSPVVCAQYGSHSANASDAPKGWSDWLLEGNALNSAGNYSVAAQAFRRALALAEGVNVGEQRLVGIYDALASAYANAGRYGEAEHEYQRALVLTEKTQGRHSLSYALLVASMAVLPTQIGHRSDVVAILHEAITINRRSNASRELAIVQTCLAQILIDEKKYVEAESVLLDALADPAGLKTTDPRQLAEFLNNLGVLRFDQRRYSESIDLCQESLGLFEGAMGNEQVSLVAPLNNLALGYLKLKRVEDAELVLRRANAICTRTLGEEHPTCGVLLEGHAVVLRKLNRKGEAKAVAVRASKIARVSRNRNGVGSTISVTALRARSNNVP